MPKYSNHVRTQIELLHNQGLHPAGILKTLKGEGLVVSLSGITCMIKKLRLTSSVANLPRSGRPRKLSAEARAFIDQQMLWAKPVVTKPKHPLKVHVWGGISRHGATKICTFDGIMDADLFCNILETTLVPFIRNNLPDHRFMQDNDPKHMSRRAQAFFEKESINGGVPLRRVLISIQSKTCGMNLSSTWNLKSSHATSKS